VAELVASGADAHITEAVDPDVTKHVEVPLRSSAPAAE
jgi:hypothetical protein